MTLWQEFRKFVARGNVFDLAVGIVIGAAFGTVVSSFVEDVLMPPVGMLTGGTDFSELYWNLSGGEYASLAEATQAGAATVNYGVFLNNLFSFLVVAAVLFLLVRQYNRLRERHAASDTPPPEAPRCPRCRTTVHPEATRCPACTSELGGG